MTENARKFNGFNKYYGITFFPKKTPLILKGFFIRKSPKNKESMGYVNIVSKDGLR